MLPATGRVIMVSGAGRGIGLAIARALHARGHGLSLGARDPERLAAAIADFADDRVMTHRFEATDAANNAAWVAATVDRFGRLDGLVNNAGIVGPATLDDADEAALDALWAVNVKGPTRMIRLAMPHLRRAGHGRIVTIASLSGKRVANDNAGYAMSKFAVVALTHAARRAGWDDGVRATALCPGLVATDMSANFTAVAREDMIQPEDLAALVATVIALPNTASVAEIPVNCRFEAML